MRSPLHIFFIAGKKTMTEFAETSRKAGNVTFTPCSQEGKPFIANVEDVSIPFEPSAFGGDGTETRKSICFQGVSEELIQQLLATEKSIDATSSCIKDSLVRCKINMEKVRCFDSARRRVETPPSLRGWHANVMVHVKGRWQTRQGCGLTLEVTDIQLIEAAREPSCPW